MYCWGYNHSGQLGLDDEVRDVVPFKQNEFFQGKTSVLKAESGRKHSLFLLEDGTVFSCGDNTSGQLGTRNNSSTIEQIHALEAQSIIDISCGDSHSVALCNQGNVFTWGTGTEGQLGTGEFPKQNFLPKRITGLSNIKIIQISCGHFHSIALSEDGKVFSWGQNNYGQLGLGKQIPNQASPQLVTSLKGIPLAQVTAGGSHSFALSMSGSVFGWGKNNAGQLGFTTKANAGMFKPYAVSNLRNLGVVYITCGDEHTAVLTKEKNVYIFGDNTYGQLGQSSQKQTSVPQKIEIEGLEGQISLVACGSFHTLVYIFTTGIIISFGKGSPRQEENNVTSHQIPISFDISSLVAAKDFLDLHVKWIFAGNNVSFATTTLQPQNSARAPRTHHLRKILQLDKTIIKKWINAKTGSDDYKEFKRVINKLFSSASCITASFIKNSTLKPLQVTYQIVDLEVASNLFAELNKDKRISSIMCSSLKNGLFPELQSLPPLYEAVCLFLLVPEYPLMYDPNTCLSLVVPFSNAVNNLSKSSLDILETLWKSLPVNSFTKIIEMVKNALVLTVLGGHVEPNRKNLLHMLEKLFKANRKANYIVPVEMFCVEQICPLIIIPADVSNWRLWQSEPEPDENAFPAIFCRFPFIFNFDTKIQALHFDILSKKTNAQVKAQQEILANRLQGSSELPKLPYFLLKVRRNHLMEDTIRKLSIVEDCDLKKELLQPAEKKLYFYFGILCGLSVFCHKMMYLPFPLAFYKKLLGKKATLDDLKELQPTMGRSMQDLLEYEDGALQNLEVYFCLTWENKTVDLIPNGTSIQVNNSNKRDYVNKCVDYIFNTSVAETFEEFRRGFYKVCDKDIISFFQPNELMVLLSGDFNYEWDMLEKNTVYLGNYSQNHPTIKMFWKVFHSLTLDQKKGFLFFLTGNDKVTGFTMQAYRVMISRFGVPDETYLPEAQTCNFILFLPEYSSIEILKEKLLLAIQNNRGYYRAQ
ncbi:probable E3 ubiquitin-protein ligase HERC6 isoform X2 [Bombina bombina]|uniref:probable E3 ubiquitin-protein ligase HERC6 isoform X2 n=1 Tax=Bombina bombina TaxID=8345 RepID=UPI00235AD637|nr:probable E3 ubiquitin-protein ligase HERC6 isoform X2 [Bombina bombina]